MERGLVRADAPRPARLGHRSPPQRRRLSVRRWPRHDPAPRARGRGARCPPPPWIDRHPHRSGRRALPSGTRPGPGWRLAPRLVCPRYEGVDERVRALVDLELSIGDYVLSGGELAGPGGHRCRPAPPARRHRRGLDGGRVVQPWPPRVPAVHAPGLFRGEAVPEILLSGDHGAVDRLARTSRRSSGPDDGDRTSSRVTDGLSKHGPIDHPPGPSPPGQAGGPCYTAASPRTPCRLAELDPVRLRPFSE